MLVPPARQFNNGGPRTKGNRGENSRPTSSFLFHEYQSGRDGNAKELSSKRS